MILHRKSLQRICKFTFISLVIVILSLLGCTNNVGPETQNENLIIGTWRWQGSCSLTNALCWYADTSMIVKDVYSINGKFARYMNDTLIASAKFQISNDTTHFPASSTTQSLIIEYFEVSVDLTSKFVKYPTVLPSSPTECTFYKNQLTVNDVSDLRRDSYIRF